MFCIACGNRYETNANFCNKCGTERPEGVAESQPVVAVAPQVKTPPPPKPPRTDEQKAKTRKLVKIGTSIVAVFALIIAVQASLSAVEYSKYVHPGDEEGESIQLAFDGDVIETITEGRCDFASLYPSKNDVRKIEKHLELMTAANSKSNRAIQSYLRDATYAWEKTNEFQADIPAALVDAFRPDLKKVIESNDKLDPKESDEWLAYWEDDLAAEIAAKCNVPLDNADWAENVNRFNAILSQLKSKADQVPWYPEGYSEWASDTTLAWKWYKGASCSSSFWSCWHIKVITQSGCPSGLYGEINIMDGGGTVIDYTNDLIGGTSPGDTVLLEFTSYNDYAETGRLTELNCY